MKRIKLFEQFQKDIRTETATTEVEAEVISEIAEEEETISSEQSEEVALEEEEENIEILEKGQPCTCEGNGCADCNGIGFHSEEELD
jgi:bacterioferritin (cytochrome b1)